MANLTNGSSRQCSLRVPLVVYDWLESLAENNPNNRYRQVATEMNAILKAAFDARNSKKRA